MTVATMAPPRGDTFDAYGLGWRAFVGGRTIRLTARRLRQEGGALRGYVDVEYRPKGTPKGVPSERVAGELVNLSSGRDRASFANRLAERKPGMDWRNIVDVFCVEVERRNDESDPAVWIGNLPAPIDGGWLVEGLLERNQNNSVHGDGACVAGETVLETADGPERIDVLAALGKPIRIWALGPDGPVIAQATCPFKKGHETLYRFSLDDGTSIVATARHRFLSLTGWRFACDVRVGEPLLGVAPSPLGTTPGLAPSTWRPDAHGSTQTLEGLTDRCDRAGRRCGPQPRSGASTARALVPSPDDAPARSRDCPCEDDWESRSGCSRPHPTTGHPSRSGSSHAELSPADGLSRAASSPSTRRSWSTRDQRPSLRDCDPRMPTLGSGQSVTATAAPDGDTSHPFALPPLDSLYHRTVISVTVEREDDYFDLHVPGYENYLAHGLWNHNTGKSWLALALAVSVSTGLEILPGYRPLLKGTVLYLDWETDHDTLNARVQQIARGYGISPPDILYLRMDGPFSDAVERILALCQEHDVVLVIIDSVEAAMAGSIGMGSPQNEGPSKINRGLRRLGRITSFMVDHISAEAAQEKGVARKAYGSIFKRNWVRLSFQLKQVRETTDEYGHLGLFNAKRNNGKLFDPVGLRWEINDEVCRWTREEIDSPELEEALPTADRIAAYLKREGPSQGSAIVDALSNVPRTTVMSTLKRGVKRFYKNAHELWDVRELAEEPSVSAPDDDDFSGETPLPWPDAGARDG